jgi:hypothetical protein
VLRWGSPRNLTAEEALRRVPGLSSSFDAAPSAEFVRRSTFGGVRSAVFVYGLLVKAILAFSGPFP